jgi:hypothetical protein
MAYEHSIQRFRNWYANLLRLYPKPYRERFGESMEQTFNDLCRERREAGNGLLGFALWVFVETSAGIIKENLTFMIMENTTRVIVWAVVVALMMMILVAMQFTEEVNWAEAAAYSVILLAAAGTYELALALRTRNSVYRVAFGIGLVTAFLLGWVNGAVGIIGNEGQPANLLYGAVFAVGLIGSLMARFKARGMARTLFAAALVQISVPVIALIIWRQISWGGAGIAGVFVLNAFFAALFVVSALQFRHAAHKEHQN